MRVEDPNPLILLHEEKESGCLYYLKSLVEIVSSIFYAIYYWIVGYPVEIESEDLIFTPVSEGFLIEKPVLKGIKNLNESDWELSHFKTEDKGLLQNTEFSSLDNNLFLKDLLDLKTARVRCDDSDKKIQYIVNRLNGPSKKKDSFWSLSQVEVGLFNRDDYPTSSEIYLYTYECIDDEQEYLIIVSPFVKG
jgi:hypothetical protein